MIYCMFRRLIAGVALCAASAASAAVNIGFGSQPGNLGPTATYTNTGLTVVATGYSDGFNFSAQTDLYGKNAGGDESGLGLVADPSGEDEIYWGNSHLGAFIELDVSALFGLVTNGQFFMGSTTGGIPAGEQWIVYGSNSAGCGWFCSGASVNGFDESPHDLFNFGTYNYYDFYSLGTFGNGAPGNVLLGGLVLTPSAVPELGTWAMMLVGFAAIGAAMRRNRKKLALTALT